MHSEPCSLKALIGIAQGLGNSDPLLTFLKIGYKLRILNRVCN